MNINAIPLIVLPFNELAQSFGIPPDLGNRLSAHISGAALTGPPSASRRHLLMVSRLPRTLYAGDPWLERMRAEVKRTAEEGGAIVASVGGWGWEYAAWCAGRFGAELIMLPPPDRPAEFSRLIEKASVQLKLPPNTTFVLPFTSSPVDKPSRLFLRDLTAYAISHQRVPVTVRPRGNWDRLCRGDPAVDWDGNLPIRKPPPLRWRSDDRWRGGLGRLNTDGYLFHWTKGWNGPWPGETTDDFFHDLTQAVSGNPRDAFSTLCHICQTGVLRGSGRLISGGTPALSFTALAPSEAVKLMRFRPGLGRWNFEPYGFSFERKTLEKLGARPVVYTDEPNNSRDDVFTQFKGTVSGRNPTPPWRGEQEWRIPGDLDLFSLGGQITILVPFQSEAEALRAKTDIRIIAFEQL